jgi:hypothetical protein
VEGAVQKKMGKIVCKSGILQAAFDDTGEGYHQNQSSGVFSNQAMESTEVKSSHCVSPAVAAWLQEVVVPMDRGATSGCDPASQRGIPCGHGTRILRMYLPVKCGWKIPKCSGISQL